MIMNDKYQFSEIKLKDQAYYWVKIHDFPFWQIGQWDKEGYFMVMGEEEGHYPNDMNEIGDIIEHPAIIN